MQTGDSARIDRILELAEQRIALAQIAVGPGTELGLGPEWTPHGHLDFVLQELPRFPGRGWPLIRAGLRSPVIRNRHLALRALSPWAREDWPAETETLLQAALAAEPDGKVRRAIEAALAGRPIEEEDNND